SLAADRGHGPARRLQGIIERRLRRLAGEEEPEPPPSPPKVIVEAPSPVVEGPPLLVEAPPAAPPIEAAPAPGPAAEGGVEADEPRSGGHDVPDVVFEGSGDAARDTAAPLDQLILAERFVSKPAAQASEITLDETPHDPLEPSQPPRQRSLSPLSSPLLGA